MTFSPSASSAGTGIHPVDVDTLHWKIVQLHLFTGGGTSIDGRGPAFAGPLGTLGICVCEEAIVSKIKNPRMGVMGMGILAADTNPP